MRLSPYASFDSIRWMTIVCCVALYLGLPASALGQAVVQLEVAPVEDRLTRQLKLTPKDRRTLRPLMEWVSDDLLSLYEYCTEKNNQDFLSLWNAIRSTRREPAKWPSGKLTRRQEKALSLARLELDGRILELWLDDYLEMLNDSLELDLVQLKHIQKVFDVEYRERLRILRVEASRPVRLDALWQQVSEDRERKLEEILTGSQLRYYREMMATPRLIAMDRREVKR